MANEVGNITLGRTVEDMSVTPEFDGYSKVVINLDDDNYVEAGTDTGRTLEIDCPWANVQTARDILARLQGFQYQPFTANGAMMNPAAELGDAVTVNGVYSGIYQYTTEYGRLFKTDVSAPQDEEVDHEYPYETYGDRKIVRKFLETKAEFEVQSDEISAKVSQVGGNNTSFGWRLTSDGFVLTSRNTEVFKANNSGITVQGEIRATSGYIGNATNGFKITSNAIYNGVLSMTDTAHYGVYLGTDGITLGKGAFKVDSQGNVTASSLKLNGGQINIGNKFIVDSQGNLSASSGTFSGTVYAGNISNNGGTSYAWGDNILATASVGGGWGGAIGYDTVSTANTVEGINDSLANGDYAAGLFTGISDYTASIKIGTVSCTSLYLNGQGFYMQSDTWYDRNGNYHSINYWGY